MTRFEMTANYVDVLKPRKPNEQTILRFKSGYGVYADINLTAKTLETLREQLKEDEVNV